MGVRILYRKVRETETEVEYSYGFHTGHDEGTLIINSQDPAATPIIGVEDPTAQFVAMKVLRSWQREQTWQDVGIIQS